MALAIIREWNSNRILKLTIPGKTGILNISTRGYFLTAVTKENQIYVWNWDDLSGNPIKGAALFDSALVLDDQRVVAYPLKNPDSLVVYRLTDQGEIHKIPFGTDNNLLHLAANRDGSFLAALLAYTPTPQSAPTYYQLQRINPDTGQSHLIITIDNKNNAPSSYRHLFYKH